MSSPPFIGGTAAAALAGVNPPNWQQPIDVYMELTGQAPEKPTSRMMGMGHLMEPLVAQLFTEATGLSLRKPRAWPDRTCSYLHPEGGCTAVLSREYPWAGAHLDRWANDGCTFEAKWAMGKDEWGPGLGVGTAEAPVIIPAPGDPEYQPRVPLRYAVQVQHGLAVTGRPLGYLAVLLGYGDFRWYALHRDELMIGTLMQLEEQFWTTNVLPGVPPDPDGSPGYTRHLRRTLEQDDGAERIATPEQAAMASALHGLLGSQAAWARAVEEARQRLMVSMGDTAKLIGPDFTISYRRSKPSLKVEWEALATDLLGRATLPHDVLRAAGIPEDDGDQVYLKWEDRTKKQRAEWVRGVARALELAHEEPGARPFRAEFASDEEQTNAT